MMTLRQNETPIMYSLYLGRTPVYDYYTDEEGNTYITGETGEYEAVYSSPRSMSANMSMSGGDAEAREYGLSVDQYEAVLVYQKGAYPIKVGDPVWVNSPIRYKDDNKEETEVEVEVREVDENGNIRKKKEKIMTNQPQIESADYTVIKLSDSLSLTKAILKAVNK